MDPLAVQALEHAGAVPMRGVRFMMAQGEGQGKVVDEVDEKTAGKRLTSIVHRAALLQELLADAPRERLHTSKKFERVDRTAAGPVILHFTDGTTHECDILIGADGIHSTVRKFILGDDPTAVPRNTGVWLIMILKPYEDAQASLGKGTVDIEEAREYSWMGNGTYVLHNLLDGGNRVQFVVASSDKDLPSDQWHRAVTANELKALYQDWPPRLVKAIDELLCTQSEHRGMCLWEHPPAHTYVSGPLWVMGDAAHATTPWHGSGGGMSIEDSLILSTLLEKSKTPGDALAALKAYDEIRRPRTQRIVESSRVTGDILTGNSEERELYTKTPGRLLQRWDFIIDIDMDKHRDEAVAIMYRKLNSKAVS